MTTPNNQGAAMTQGWEPIAIAPQDGQRVRVAHLLDPFSLRDSRFFNTTGVYQNGEWACTAGFVCVDGLFRFTPTHWQPLPPPPTGDAA